MTWEKEKNGTLSDEVSGPITTSKPPPEVITEIDRERDRLLKQARANLGYPSTTPTPPLIQPAPIPTVVTTPTVVTVPPHDVQRPPDAPNPPRFIDACAPNTPDYQAVLDHAARSDEDRDGLKRRVDRIIHEAEEMLAEAIRVRDENRATLDVFTGRARPFPPAPFNQPAPPASLIAWVRSEIKRLPVAKNTYPVMGFGDTIVTLGELRDWLNAIDGAAKREP